MAFPDDYHINVVKCTDRMGQHKWSTMGHPLTHRCGYCHRIKWVQNPPPPITSPQHGQMLEVRKL